MSPERCGSPVSDETRADHESVQIRKTKASCSLCEDYAREQSNKPIAVLSCEGACLRGEISRQTANILCHELLPEKTVRICLGGAFTKDTGQRALVRDAPRVVALEGCPIDCASRMMEGVLPGRAFEVVHTDRMAQFDPRLFGIDALGPDEIRACARAVAVEVASGLSEVVSRTPA